MLHTNVGVSQEVNTERLK